MEARSKNDTVAALVVRLIESQIAAFKQGFHSAAGNRRGNAVI